MLLNIQHDDAKDRLSSLLHTVASNEAHIARNRRIRERADELVEKTMPRRTGPAPHGFYRFGDFVEAAAYNGRRNNLVKLTIAELHAQEFGYDTWDADYDAAVARLTRRAA